MYPEAFETQMKVLLGDEFERFLEALSASPPVSIRLNPAKPITWELPGMEPIPWHPEGRYLPQRPQFTLDPRFHAGAYYVQEASSMLLYAAVQQHLPAGQPWKVLDLCAAPGGKSTMLSSMLPAGSVMIANEVVGSRAKVLLENLTKWGATKVIVTNHDVRDFTALYGYFDLVLVDAPCSGEGLFRKTPAAVEEWSEAAVEHCADRQQHILAEAVPLLRPGGILLYSTCTYNTLENEQNAQWAMETLDMEPLSVELPETWGLKACQYGYQCFPHRVRGEGFYFAAFRAGAERTWRAGKTPRSSWLRLPAALRALEANWFDESFSLELRQHDKYGLAAFPSSALELLDRLPRHWPVLRLGRLKGNELIPDPALALSQACSSKWPRVELSEEEALSYLRRTGPQKVGTAEKGWVLATYSGLNLGWMKVLPNRINNYWPAEWRIRMGA